jgi:hypothetical protein
MIEDAVSDLKDIDRFTAAQTEDWMKQKKMKAIFFIK